jgi:S1-C subfamily serine protease
MKLSKFFLFVVLFFLNITFIYAGEHMDIIELSRNSCVKIYSKDGNSSGSGFFISDDLIATCFHVIASINQNGQQINWDIYQDLQITTITGENINANCISPPTKEDPSPFYKDFVILKLTKKPANLKNYILQFSDKDIKIIKIGSDCYFSGYPLLAPTLITHKGMISGIDDSGDIICIQGSINKGNSGGALISDDGKVIGIVSMREGGISKALADLTTYIKVTEKQGSVLLKGVDPLQAIKEITKILDTYISTGIGYAINIKYLKEYSFKNQIVK